MTADRDALAALIRQHVTSGPAPADDLPLVIADAILAAGWRRDVDDTLAAVAKWRARAKRQEGQQ